MAKNLTTITSGFVAVAVDDVDTDQIIPARFMTTTTKDGLGQVLFHDARRSASGKHPLDEQYRGQQVLLGGRNFGCGSSREHAVWAILDFGFRVVLAPSFGDIFRNNALNNGLLVAEISDAFYESLVARSNALVEINLEASTITDDVGERHSFSIDSFNKACLIRGLDRLDYLITKLDLIRTYERRREHA